MSFVRFDARADYQAVLKDLTELEKKIAPAAAAAALNRAADRVRTVSVREIASAYQIRPQRVVRSRFGRVSRANRRRLLVAFTVGLSPIPVIVFGETPGRWGSSAFVAVMPEGHRGIFERTGEAKRIPKKGRYADRGIKREPIREIKKFMPGAGAMIERNIATVGAQSWRENFARELAWRLRRVRGG